MMPVRVKACPCLLIVGLSSAASLESALRRRMNVSQQREGEEASLLLARMRLAAALKLKTDPTSSGSLQQLSLDSKTPLEVRLRAALLKRKAEETLQQKRASILRAKEERIEALAAKAKRVSDLLTWKKEEAESKRQRKTFIINKRNEALREEADAAAIRAAAQVSSNNAKQQQQQQKMLQQQQPA
ncbi:hypothetical protein Efla_002862 [Eimeria flavescens]